jgi:hypothetical protein
MPNLLPRIILGLLVAGLSASVAQAESLCPPTIEQSKAEGVWRIPEEAFTEQSAKRELKKLNRLLGAEGLTVDSIAWETSFVYIEGWYLRRQALAAKGRGESGFFVSDFCDFLTSRAYVRH